ncbi:MAG: hypothetical protein O7G88_12015 [bacterium]|jgi:hypothetical protein|nr:hypothetical protein [bacterium]
MRRLTVIALACALMLGLSAASALAYHCPLLVKECNALASKMEKKPNADKKLVAEAKQGCADALQLHSTGKHADAVIKAGEAISMAGKSAK